MIEITNGYRTTWLPDKIAAELIFSTTKTIQRYKNPDNRDPAKWELLKAKALGQLLPPAWNMCIDNDKLHTATDYAINSVQLEQFGWHLTTFSQMRCRIDQLKARISELENRAHDSIASNVIPFPTPTKEA